MEQANPWTGVGHSHIRPKRAQGILSTLNSRKRRAGRDPVQGEEQRGNQFIALEGAAGVDP